MKLDNLYSRSSKSKSSITMQVPEKLTGAKPLFENYEGLIAINDATSIYLCVRAKPYKGACMYAVCGECYVSKAEDSGRKHRTKDKQSPSKKKREACCHGPQDLETDTNLYWCKPEWIGTERWFERAHGCHTCRRMFVHVGNQGITPKLPEGYVFPDVSEFPDAKVREAYEEERKGVKRLDDGKELI